MGMSSVSLLASAPPEQVEAVWEEARGRLRQTLNDVVYGMVFERARAVRLTGERITLEVATEFCRSWIAQRHMSLLKDALFEVLGVDVAVDLEVADEPHEDCAGGEPPQPSAPAVRAPVQAPPVPRSGRRALQPRYTFEEFVTGPSNRFAQAAALAVAEAPARAYNPLFIYGGVGLGKTHLLHAIGHFVERNHPELALSYVSVETFTNEFVNALRDGTMRSFKDRYRSIDVLLIDDIQSLAGREQTQEEFFHTFNELHDGGKQIVICSDRAPKAIATLEDRLRSRFEMGLITDIQPPDLETRIAILRKRVESEGYEIRDPDVLSYIASRVSTNVRQLEGALVRLMAKHSVHGFPVSVDLAREILQDLVQPGEGVLTVEAIQGETCRHYGVSIADLRSQKRTKRVVEPRQVAMYLARELTDASLPSIGRAFGGRDHTTVMHAVQKVARQMGDEGAVYAAVQTLTARLTGHA